jgi:hypothetical protein
MALGFYPRSREWSWLSNLAEREGTSFIRARGTFWQTRPDAVTEPLLILVAEESTAPYGWTIDAL